MKTKQGVILLNAYSQLPTSTNQAQRLKEEFEKLGVRITILKNNFFGAAVEKNQLVPPLTDCDFCVYLDKDKYLSQALENSGIRIFNSHSAIQACDDKMITSLTLAGKGVSMPKTLAGLLCYDPEAQISESMFNTIESRLGYPVIVKESYGSLGKGVYKADNREQLKALAEKLKCVPHLFQQCITQSLGTDVRVIVIGGKFIAAMRRTSLNDFRSNLGLGGNAVAVSIDKELEGLCIKTANLLSLDYCGIDVLKDDNGYYVCEVNSNAFFGGIEKATGINVAKAYSQHICGVIY